MRIKMSKKAIIIVVVVVVLAVIVYFNFAMNTTQTTSVQAAEAKSKKLTEQVSASGRIQPQTKVDITAEINGEIISLLVSEGDHVKVGDLLIVLDTVQLRSDVDQAKFAVSEIDARLNGARVALEQAEEEFHRQEKLYEGNLASEIEFKNARYTYLNYKSSHEASQAQFRQAQFRYEQRLDNLSKAKLVAPMPGIITFLDCEVGEIAPAQTAFTQGKTLMRISNLDVFEVEVEVDETEINKIALNQAVDIEVDAFPDTTFPGQVVEIGNTAILEGLGTEDQSTNFKVKVIFQDPNVKIRPGMSATVDVTTDQREDALTIPYSAVVMRSYDMDSLARARETEESDSGGDNQVLAAEDNPEGESEEVEADDKDERKELKGVFVIRDGKARFLVITTGIADQKDIEVVSGVAAGDSVISGPYRVLRSVKDGDAVETEEPSDEQKE